MRRGLAVVGLALLTAACQASPATPRVAAPARDVAAAARAALARRDWAAAAPLFREAIAREPGSLTLHYGLAVCATYLDATDEAIREFGWVLAHAARDSDEAKLAGAWLAQGGPSGEPSAALPLPGEPDVADGTLSGSVTWAEPGRAAHGREGQVVLVQGILGTPTQGLLYRTRTDEHGRYELRHLVPGPYKVTDAIGLPAVWRLRVVVQPGQTSVLDLGPDNRRSVRDDFPEGGRPGEASGRG